MLCLAHRRVIATSKLRHIFSRLTSSYTHCSYSLFWHCLLDSNFSLLKDSHVMCLLKTLASFLIVALKYPSFKKSSCPPSIEYTRLSRIYTIRAISKPLHRFTHYCQSIGPEIIHFLSAIIVFNTILHVCHCMRVGVFIEITIERRKKPGNMKHFSKVLG